ncbi:hypothetical protein [Alteraurantiacibacter aquimixticola]|uniref:Uncharacterized protein n=1 Tax=Alteraurantiacibacter aquimixticola TaxID=2489173 RepID=A0A4V4U8G3_9SPHN|nr:hypothetical protein [Alteraurantiacibacter aquimixticola]TIX49770.1 hypothetical protein E5222_13245 [Alteraurantiacibacter aquimixticola]
MVLRSRKSRKALVKVDEDKKVTGATDNPAANLLMADIVMRTGSYLLRNFVERSFLKGRYGKQTARQMVKNRPVTLTLASIAVAKIATRSVPGALVVSTGLIAKALYDRGRSRHTAESQGDAELLDRVED